MKRGRISLWGERSIYKSKGFAHPWVCERHYGFARGLYNRLVADDLFSGKQILAGVQWRLNTLSPRGGFSAYQSVFGSNPEGLSGWGDKDEDLLCARDTSLSGQFAQQWQLPLMAREAVLGEAANSKLR